MAAPQETEILALELFNEALAVCDPRTLVAAPPLKDIVLVSRGTRTIYIEGSWGPAIPYPAVRHEDGTQNHGYRPIKGDREAIEMIPEVQGYPDLAEFLVAINASDTQIESVGCEKLLQEEIHEQQTIFMVSCYVDIIFSDLPANEDPHSHLQLAARLAAAVDGCEQWWTRLELALQRFRALPRGIAPWGLMVRVLSGGRSLDEAKQMWSHSLQRLARAVAAK